MENLTEDEVDILSIAEECYDFDELLVHLKFKKLQPKHQKDDTQTPLKKETETKDQEAVC